MSFKVKALLFGIAALTLVLFVADGFYTAKEGQWYAIQNNIFHKVTYENIPGFHLRVPFANLKAEYKNFSTIDFTADGTSQTYDGLPISVKFADTYRAKIPVTFRYKTMKNESIHEDFRSFENLVDNLLVKNAKSVTVATAEQYTGEEFFQGGLSAFRAALEDQLNNGLYVTEREKVEIEEVDIALADVDSENKTVEMQKKMVWKTVPQRDEQGNIKRMTNPLSKYGIEVVQVTIGEPVPEDSLQTMLVEKKKLVAQRISSQQQQETAKEQAKTEKLLKDIEIQKAVQEAQLKKKQETINAQRVAEVAKINKQQEKDVAEIQKAKELAISIANREIEEANYEASKFAAQAIKEKGFAEAEVLNKHYKALWSNKEIVLAEYDKEVKLALSTGLEKFKIQMPQYLSTSNGSGGTPESNLKAIFDAFAVNQLKSMTTPTQK